MIKFLSKVYSKVNNKILFKRGKTFMSFAEQKSIVESFPEPEDDYERSFDKYKCVMLYHYKIGFRVLYNIVSFFVFPFLWAFYRIKSRKKENVKPNEGSVIAIKEGIISVSDIIPPELVSKYDKSEIVKGISYSSIYLNKEACKILSEARRKHPFNSHYLLVLLVRLSYACYIIDQYNPNCVTTYVCEREFCDPLITMFYEMHDIEYHGFMHGEYMYTLDKAFMRYTGYWVWDTYYEKMFTRLRFAGKFHVYVPGKYSPIDFSLPCEHKYFITYYFGEETAETVNKVKEIFDMFAAHGKECRVRPHPRFSDIENLKKVFSEHTVEDTHSVSISDSIRSTEYLLSVRSTVLTQAYYNSRKIVIDDCTDKALFDSLIEFDYMLIDKADCLLSELIEKVKRGEV